MAARKKPDWVKPSDMRQPPEIIPDDAELRDEELFDEDGDIPDDDEVIIGANGVEGEEWDKDPDADAIFGDTDEEDE